ncbi:transmembrane amino acid transporter protein [Oesophagostomum dentatum]|uniref:Transmembrane amino acid transporter protein n=1 Tax=Oesophagostomum dentatum TaxID=61180 RepID=A0A0B1ST27_OESDE|nr:transmembrane amino acid transporter protein [Oesophagostomum dentatum]
MVKAMLGTGLLSLPLAFKHSGLFLGLILTVVICLVCLYCMRQVVFAAHFVCNRNGRDLIDYANIMRGAVEMGPPWIRHKGYFFKQMVNVNMFVSQLGFCCVYFVFMADNLEDFFNSNTSIHLSKATWMVLLLIPMLSICSIRRLSVLAPFAMAANIVYIIAVAIVLFFFVSDLRPVNSLPWYLSLGDEVKDTATLNLPMTPFYQTIKLMFVACIMISYPLQFYVPMERAEKWITRKIPVHKQTMYIYTARYAGVLATCAVAEMVPHLALFISLIGSFSGASMALLFPPCIEMLTRYAKGEITPKVWAKNIFLVCFALLGFTTGTYAALSEIFKKFAQE